MPRSGSPRHANAIELSREVKKSRRVGALMMVAGSTAHRAYIFEVDRAVRDSKERVTLLVDYGRNQARVEITVTPLTSKGDQTETYRHELAELARVLSEIVASPRGLRWMSD
jgi:hypothetical protein